MQVAMQQAMLDAVFKHPESYAATWGNVVAGRCKIMLNRCLMDAYSMHKTCIADAYAMQRRCLYLRKHACGMPARGGRTDGRTHVRTPPPWELFLTLGNARNARRQTQNENQSQGEKK